jgi:hypothetical protein
MNLPGVLVVQLCDSLLCVEDAVARVLVVDAEGGRTSLHVCQAHLDELRGHHAARDPSWPQVRLVVHGVKS